MLSSAKKARPSSARLAGESPDSAVTLLTLLLLLAGPVFAGPCPQGDLNGDCAVNPADLQILAEHWLGPAGSVGDIDGLSGVNTVDLALLARDWLSSPQGYTLVINEFMADNGSFMRDPQGDYDDWIEIYNYGDNAIDIAGMYLTDDLDTPKLWRVPSVDPSATTIEANGYLIIWADNEAAEGPLHTNFKLSAGGEEIGLYAPNGTEIDSIVFGAQNTDKSYGRLPDGSANWQVLDTATPGRANQSGLAKVIISEIMYHPYHPVPSPENISEEYIELFNANAAPVNIGGWRLSDGVDFTFPAVVLDVGGYLVVAADVNAFSRKYPGVSNVVGGWTGWLSNSGERIELVDETGVVIDSVRYADEGEWAGRERGPVDHSHRGWQWSDAHDGGGKSLELINFALSNDYGQNWAASTISGGTPGQPNSVAADDVPPLILDVGQKPIIPGPIDAVTITARIIDEKTVGLSVALLWRIDGQASFNKQAMYDDGAHGDGPAGNGVYGAVIPAQPDRAVVEFYVEAADDGGKVRTWPAPSSVDGVPQQMTNALYQVNASFDPQAPWVPGSQPVYYLIMTEQERAELALIGSRSNGEEDSDAQMNGTFISIDGTSMELHYGVGIRNRGHGTRTGPPNNYHVTFSHDRLWKGVGSINFNCRYTYVQIIGSMLFRMAGCAAADTTAVQLRINGANLASTGSPMYGVYVGLEAFSDDFAKEHFPGDPNGNLYTCFRDAGEAQLLYQGTDPNTYRNSYIKANHEAQQDWSDLIHTVDVLNNAPNATYFQDVSKVINVSQWLHYIALDSLLVNYETGLNMGIGDDYFLYRGVVDPRFVLIPHDLDTILDQGNTHGNINQSIFSVVNGVAGYDGVDGLKRFFSHPDVIPLYYQAFLDNINDFFNPETLDPLFDQVLGGFTPQDRIDAMKQFVGQRTTAVLAQIPQKLTISSSLPLVGGYPHTTSMSYTVSGTADAAGTRSVLVNGQLASWVPVGGSWLINGGALNPGINRVIVQTFDESNGAGAQLEQRYIDIWYEDGNVSDISGTLVGNRVLDAALGPWHVVGSLIVPAGVSLTIMPGTSVFFEPNSVMTIRGQLIAEGTLYSQIRFTRTPGTTGTWRGLQFVDSASDNRISFAVVEYGRTNNGMIGVERSNLVLDHVMLDHTDLRRVHTIDSSLIVRNCLFTDIFGPGEPPTTDNMSEHIWGSGVPKTGWFIIENSVFGTLKGHNDAIDFDGPVRPDPIPQILNNIFSGGGDDALDLETDAHIEGNVFMNFRKDVYNTAPREGNSISAGAGREYVVVRNVFHNVDHVAQIKDDSYMTFVNNTVVDVNLAAFYFEIEGQTTSPGKGVHIDSCIFRNVPTLLADFYVNDPTWGTTDIEVNNSLLPTIWHNYGTGNIDADPLFVDENDDDFHLKAVSPAVGAGSNDLDMGAFVPAGAAVSGEPTPMTWRTDALLNVGGSGITHYKFSVNNPAGPWSEERTVNVPINLTGLNNGSSYIVYVLGKDSAGIWQVVPSESITWTVNTSYHQLVINEVLAANKSVFEHEGTFPDLVELYYDGPSPLDLSGMRMTDDPNDPPKFVFPAGTTIAPGQYRVLFADANAVTSGTHLGFALAHEGDGVYLYDKNSTFIDSVEFGLQVPDLSIGRVGKSGQWHLTVPTFGQANSAQPLGNPDTVKINEWFTDGQVLFEDDFIELYNPHANPVDLGDMYLTNNPVTQPGKHKIRLLSFIGGEDYAVFWADNSNDPVHINFRLSPDVGMIGLFDSQLREINKIFYGPQTTDVSEGRVPDGAERLDFLPLPTPGVANPLMETTTTTTITFVDERADKRVLVPVQTVPVSDNWKGANPFDDSAWMLCTGGPGGVGYERDSGYQSLITLDTETQMYGSGKNNTCYIRVPFTVDVNALADIHNLILKVRYDDGFIAYLNGMEVDSRNYTGTPSWNSYADSAIEASVSDFDEYFDISEYKGQLKAGANILAIHGMNNSTTSSDFLISVALEVVLVKVEGTLTYENELNLLDGLRITELMYNAAGGSDFDYIELQNVGNVTLDVTGVRITDGVDFIFPQMILTPGQYVVVAADLDAFRSRYGTTIKIAGEYVGNFNNTGEQVVLNLPWPLHVAVLRFSYDDTWYPTTNGGGDSLVIDDPLGPPDAWNRAENWHAASPSPGGP